MKDFTLKEAYNLLGDQMRKIADATTDDELQSELSKSAGLKQMADAIGVIADAEVRAYATAGIVSENGLFLKAASNKSLEQGKRHSGGLLEEFTRK